MRVCSSFDKIKNMSEQNEIVQALQADLANCLNYILEGLEGVWNVSDIG